MPLEFYFLSPGLVIRGFFVLQLFEYFNSNFLPNLIPMAVKKKENPIIVQYQIDRNKVWEDMYGIFFCEKETEQGGKMCDQQCDACRNHYTDMLK